VLATLILASTNTRARARTHTHTQARFLRIHGDSDLLGSAPTRLAAALSDFLRPLLPRPAPAPLGTPAAAAVIPAAGPPGLRPPAEDGDASGGGGGGGGSGGGGGGGSEGGGGGRRRGGWSMLGDMLCWGAELDDGFGN
jgi:uncharacterized membrane protein YgcG